ncbi:MAG: hypothetical protein ACI8PZ_005427 [Myxococcota bacterium]|jgi:hypothetical protein
MQRWVILAVALGVGCSGVEKDGGVNSASATIYDGDALTEPCEFSPDITLVDVSCDARGYRFYAETTGWVARARLNIWEVVDGNKLAGWNEEHTLDTLEYDPACTWDHLERILTQGATDYTFTPDSNTLFICDTDPAPPDNPDDRPNLTYAVRVYDQSLNYVNCVMWGANIEEVLQDPSGIGVGDVPNINPITNPAQLTSCDVLL